MHYFHAEVTTSTLLDSDARAEELARLYADEIRQAGGELQVGRNYGDRPAILMVSLPDGANPDELIPPGLSFYEVRATTTPAVEDHGIRE